MLPAVEVVARYVAGFDGVHAVALGDFVIVLNDKAELGHCFGTLGINVVDLQESHTKALVRHHLKKAVRKELTQHKLLIM